MMAFSDIVVDISAMPRSVYFPLLARLLYFHDKLKPKGRMPQTFMSWLPKTRA